MDIDFWQAIQGTQVRLNITRYDLCGACRRVGFGDVRHGRGRLRTMQGPQLAQMAGAMKFNLTCPRCGGSGETRTPVRMRRRGRVTRTETVETRIPRARATVPLRCRERARRDHGSASGGLYITTKVEEHPSSTARATTLKSGFPSRCGRPALGAKIEVPYHRWPHAPQIPQGPPTASASGCARREY